MASSDDKSAPRLILACEEPELYQHPPQAKHLASVFETLSGSNTQVIVTTHSPYFVVGKDFEAIRMVRRADSGHCSKISQYSYSQFAAEFLRLKGTQPKNLSATVIKLHQALQPQLNEMFFTQHLILVEGIEDSSYIQSWMTLTGRWVEYRRLGCHMVPALGKNNLLKPAIIAKGLGIPYLIIFDADGQSTHNRSQLQIDNTALLRLVVPEVLEPFPSHVTTTDNILVWPHNIGTSVKTEMQSRLGALGFEVFDHKVRGFFDHACNLDKDALFIAEFLSQFRDSGQTLECLDMACDWILERCKANGQ